MNIYCSLVNLYQLVGVNVLLVVHCEDDSAGSHRPEPEDHRCWRNSRRSQSHGPRAPILCPTPPHHGARGFEGIAGGQLCREIRSVCAKRDCPLSSMKREWPGNCLVELVEPACKGTSLRILTMHA